MLSLIAAPLDDGHRARQGELQVQVVELFGTGEAVGVHVHQVGAAGAGAVRQVWVHAREHEGR